MDTEFETKEDVIDDPSVIVNKALDGLRTTLDERFTALESKTADFDKFGKRLDAI